MRTFMLSSRFRSRLSSLSVIGGLLLFAACSGQGASDADSDGTTETTKSALILGTGITLWDPAQPIPVCWATAGYVQSKQWIQLAVNRTWARASTLTFSGWGDCPTNPTDTSKAVRIHIDEATDVSGGVSVGGGQTQRQGTYALQTALDAATLHCQYDESGQGIGGSCPFAIGFSLRSDNSSIKIAKGRVEYIGVHEFGHLLGFQHEQDRTDDLPGVPGYCANPKGSEGYIAETVYDPLSIMNYCADLVHGYLSILDRAGLHNVYPARPNKAVDDFNNDGKSDLGVWRPSNGTWYTQGLSNIVWGAPGDIAVPADYNGDGVTDRAIWRPSTGQWWVYGATGTVPVWGQAGDVPVPADYLGTGRAQFAVWRPSTGQWWVYGATGAIPVWGLPGDKPVPGDWIGDGKARYAIWRPSTQSWWIDDAQVPVTIFPSFGSGQPDEVPVPGDYLGEGKIDFASWSPSLGRWKIAGLPDKIWGVTGDVATPGDYYGEGLLTIGVWRPSNTTFYYDNITNVWGAAGDTPFPKLWTY